jgi:hypothetical protein
MNISSGLVPFPMPQFAWPSIDKRRNANHAIAVEPAVIPEPTIEPSESTERAEFPPEPSAETAAEEAN